MREIDAPRGPAIASCAAAALLSLLGTGCEAAVATYPHCPVPVLISEVNRVGVKTPAPTIKTGVYDVLKASSGILAEGTSSTSSSGGVTTTTTTGYRESAGPPTLTLEALTLSPSKADADVSDLALDGVWTGTFMVVLPGYFVNQIWVDPKGRKVWVK
jgi:hypothetical protein